MNIVMEISQSVCASGGQDAELYFETQGGKEIKPINNNYNNHLNKNQHNRTVSLSLFQFYAPASTFLFFSFFCLYSLRSRFAPNALASLRACDISLRIRCW